MPLAKNLLQCRISFLKFDQGASIEEFLRDASFHHRYELVGLRPLRVSLPKPLMLAIARESDLVGLRGLEPPTSRLSGVRSNHLSYKPRRTVVVSVFRRPLVEMRRIELLTPCLQGRCSPS